MKNNLLKSVAAAATASALLFSTVTSFAATATTVTTYRGGNKVGVTSTITGAPVGKMITYLASSGTNGAVNSEKDIKYIGQKTVPADGSKVEFSYDIDGAKVGETVATVRYGSDDAATATDLNKDASSAVVYGDLTVKAYGCTVKPETATVGNGNPVNVTIDSIQTGYELKEVWINGVKSEQNLSLLTYQVKYADNMEFVAICGAKTDSAAATNVVAVNNYFDADTNTVGVICNKYATTTDSSVKFGVVAVKDGNNDPYIMSSNMVDNFYEAGATVAGTEESYYAVELCCDDYANLKLIPAYKTSDGIIHRADDNN